MGVEQQALGLTTAGAEALRVKTELLNELQRAGIKLTPEYAAKVEELAHRSGEAAAALEAQAAAQAALVASLDEVRGTAYDVLGGYLSDVRNGVSQTDALNNALNRVLDTIIEIGLQNVIKSVFGALGTTQTGILDGLVSALTGGSFGGSKAVGGPVNAGQIYRVGERGPEMFVPDVAGRIVPNHAMAGGGKGSVTVSMPISIDARGADEAGLARVQQQLAQLRGEIPRMVVTSVANAKRRNVQGI
ncbi:MAG: phage tape measure protein [Devosia sp.]|jgi:hypothetical protein|nr:phage tape measure protein [Devosia sp.]